VYAYNLIKVLDRGKLTLMGLLSERMLKEGLREPGRAGGREGTDA